MLALAAMTMALAPQPGSAVRHVGTTRVDVLRPPAVVRCDRPATGEGTIVVGVRFHRRPRAGAARVYAGRLGGFVTSESGYWLHDELGGGWHYKRVYGHCGRTNFVNYRLGRRKPGVRRAVRLRVRVRAAA